MGIAEKGILLRIWNSTAGARQPGDNVKINRFRDFAEIRNTAN